LRLRQRGGKHARDGHSDELFVHEISPVTDKIGKKQGIALAVETFSGDIEKLQPLCQTAERRGKAKAVWHRGARVRVAKTLQEYAFIPFARVPRPSVNASKAPAKMMIEREKFSFPGIRRTADPGRRELTVFPRPAHWARDLLSLPLRPAPNPSEAA
jgi:hypothetical protein